MRMLSSWATIRDQERPERFLYTYLKYGFLRLRNADRREALQPLDQDFDLLDMSAASTGPGLIEWQEEIRAVVDFLCWRKAAAKSASLLLFRFFHGMFPSEIMLIASMSRKAVDDSLASSKLEARTYVNQNASPRADTLRKKHSQDSLVRRLATAVGAFDRGHDPTVTAGDLCVWRWRLPLVRCSAGSIFQSAQNANRLLVAVAHRQLRAMPGHRRGAITSPAPRQPAS